MKMVLVSCFSPTTFSLIMILLTLYMSATKTDAKPGFLPLEEVIALSEIAEQVGKKEWNLSVNPCSKHPSWYTPYSKEKRPLYNNSLECNCSFPGGVCHVQHLFLKGQDLDGVLPKSIVKLPYLKILDLTRNYLQGNIPPEWAAAPKLEYLSISVNSLTGQIPSYLGRILTLIRLDIENNLFSGTVPPELGNLVNLENLVLNANNLTGTLPLALTSLSKLTELRVSYNNFNGTIPDIFGNWSQLTQIQIQGSGFKGPIPSSISSLKNLTELRISDLEGKSSTFPRLESMNSIKYLMLTSCNLNGSMPENVTKMPQLKILDISFNSLEGNLPQNFDGLVSLEKMYLTRNLFRGPIVDWLQTRTSRTEIDLSYNNFSDSSLPSDCRETLNLFKSTWGGNNSKPVKCASICSKERYSVHINCGGKPTTVNRTITYEGDEESGGAAKYIPVTDRSWVVSTTGHYWDRNATSHDYIAANKSILGMDNPELYMTARLSPLSLTYYLRCLKNGNYTVKLHFAEIVIRDNSSFYSLGRRIFDAYIQETRVLRDFEIKRAAQGVDKPHIEEVNRVAVTDGTLEIRFHWSGKGTVSAPEKGTYGPLISAITVDSEFKPPNEGEKKKLIVSGTAVLVLLVLVLLGALWWKGYLGSRTSLAQELRGLDLQTGIFTFRQIRAATNDFDPRNKIGEGGFGSVYKGTLSDGTIVAVKQLSSKSSQGNREFVNEIGMISGLQHPNLVRLYGCCIEGKQLLLVYEYMENNSLANALFGKSQLKLDWPTRQRICIGIAKGLAFLHEESTLKIVHRDIKTTNVLLDRDLNPKISDFGLAKLDEEENTHISTRVAGTIGYMAPEYALWGYLTYKADVYSFGVVAMEIVAGQSNMKHRPQENFVCLVDKALVLQQKGDIMELVDPRLESEFNKEEAIRIVKIALLCTNPSPALRPDMSAVVSMLEGEAAVHDLVMDPSIYGDELRLKALMNHFDQISHHNTSENKSPVGSSSALWTGTSSSTSAQDLYPIRSSFLA